MIDILLACYNGEKYIAEQIESIIAQDCDDWRLIIQDDCSHDKTAEKAAKYVEKFPEKVVFYQRETPTGSAMKNFLSMLHYATGDYIMFSDQDDFWRKDKLSLTLSEMKRLEAENGDIPLLVHTDLIVADERLGVKADSFFAFQGLDKHAKSLNKLLVQNNVTGCTMMINRKLADMVKESPDMLMHDWWIALIASGMGKIGFVDRPTILYRQHGNNQLGAVNNRRLSRIFPAMRDSVSAKKRILLTYTQAEAFFKLYGDRLSNKNRALVELYISIPQKNKVGRTLCLMKNDFTKQSFVTKVGQIFYC